MLEPQYFTKINKLGAGLHISDVCVPPLFYVSAGDKFRRQLFIEH